MIDMIVFGNKTTVVLFLLDKVNFHFNRMFEVENKFISFQLHICSKKSLGQEYEFYTYFNILLSTLDGKQEFHVFNQNWVIFFRE